MNTSELIQLLSSSIRQDARTASSMVVCGHYPDKHGTNLEWRQLGAVHWDNEELFLVPGGYAHIYGLQEHQYSASSLLVVLESEEGLAGFPVYVRSRIKQSEGNNTIASLNLPIWGCAAYPEHHLFCLVYGEKPHHME